MSASNFNLRGIPEEIMAHLKREAKRLHTSVNVLILQMIKRGLGFSQEKVVYHDLDHLAGSWSRKQEKDFKKSTRHFEKIDKGLWE
jgi:hypothetical protein